MDPLGLGLAQGSIYSLTPVMMLHVSDFQS